MSDIGASAIKFYSGLKSPRGVGNEIGMINPYQKQEILGVVKKFYRKFYADSNKRCYVFGINPGRIGSGCTGVPFTDADALENVCGIDCPFHSRKEMTSDFVYKVIEKYGEVKKFYKKFYLTATSPVGFIKDGKNYNYYDSKELERKMENYIIKNIKAQIRFGARTNVAIIWGSGKNFQTFSRLNEKHKFFDKIIPLEHPRYIMQYQRKNLNKYIKKYIKTLESCI